MSKHIVVDNRGFKERVARWILHKVFIIAAIIFLVWWAFVGLHS